MNKHIRVDKLCANGAVIDHLIPIIDTNFMIK